MSEVANAPIDLASNIELMEWQKREVLRIYDNPGTLRRALQRFGLSVQTVYGYGYRMQPKHQRQALNLIFNTA